MDELTTINILKHPQSADESDWRMAVHYAIQSIEELVQYKNVGTLEEIREVIKDKNKLTTVRELLVKMCNEYDSDFDKTIAECLAILEN